MLHLSYLEINWQFSIWVNLPGHFTSTPLRHSVTMTAAVLSGFTNDFNLVFTCATAKMRQHGWKSQQAVKWNSVYESKLNTPALLQQFKKGIWMQRWSFSPLLSFSSTADDVRSHDLESTTAARKSCEWGGRLRQRHTHIHIAWGLLHWRFSHVLTYT